MNEQEHSQSGVTICKFDRLANRNRAVIDKMDLAKLCFIGTVLWSVADLEAVALLESLPKTA